MTSLKIFVWLAFVVEIDVSRENCFEKQFLNVGRDVSRINVGQPSLVSKNFNAKLMLERETKNADEMSAVYTAIETANPLLF